MKDFLRFDRSIKLTWPNYRWLLLLFLFFNTAKTDCCAQHEQMWVLAGEGGLTGLDFNSGTPTSFPSSILENAPLFREACAMYCDEAGKLQFYTDGDRAWNRLHQKMNGGKSILGLDDYPSATSSSHQGTVIVPFPDNSKRFYIFSVAALTGGSGPHAANLFYCIIDMNLNGGLGDMVSGSSRLLAQRYTEGITAVKGNRCNVWLLAKSNSNGYVHAFEINNSGLSSEPVISEVVVDNRAIIAAIKASPQRDRIVLADFVNNLHLLQFNPNTGKASNPISIPYESNSGGSNRTFVPEFSPDGKLFYARTGATGIINQYDISVHQDREINGSKIPITGSDGGMRLGPDNKIYFTRKGNIDRLNNPNMRGKACDHQEAIFKNASLGSAPGPNVIAMATKGEKRFTNRRWTAACFANVHPPELHPSDTLTGWDYQWNTGTTTTTITPDTPGTYWISYRTPPCNFHTDTFQVVFPEGVLPYIFVDTACKGINNGKAFAFTYPGDPVIYSYTWRDAKGIIVSASDTLHAAFGGRYSLRVQTKNCDTTIDVFVPEALYSASFKVDTVICQNQSFKLRNNADAHFTRFHWDFGNGYRDSVFEPRYTYPHSGLYNITLYARGKYCSDTFHHLVTVDTLFTASFTVKPDTLCEGETTLFQSPSATSINGYQWLFGDSSSISASSASDLHHAYDNWGKKTVHMRTYYRACPESVYTRNIYVQPMPRVVLGPDTALCLNGAPITISPKVDDADGSMIYRWSTGDTTKTMVARNTGIYVLQVRNAFGCMASEDVRVHKDCYTDIPNAFTPNGDGFNDYFFPMSPLRSGMAQYHLQILNRWGQSMFETRELKGRGWDGRYNGMEQVSGVYIYRLQVTYKDGRSETYTGNVSLLR